MNEQERINHMEYLPGMEVLKSDLLDRVIESMNGYDYDKYTEADVRRALSHEERLSLIHI